MITRTDPAPIFPWPKLYENSAHRLFFSFSASIWPLFEYGRRELRAKHTPEALKASRDAHEANKAKLKSDLKKTTAFTKKVKALSEDQRASLDKDVDALNLSRYVSEVVDAVAENRLKNADVPVAVHLCCLMHQRCVLVCWCWCWCLGLGGAG